MALVAPFLGGDPAAPSLARNERLAADTLRSAQRLRTAEAAVTAAESALAVARATPTRGTPSAVPSAAPPTAATRVTTLPAPPVGTLSPALALFSRRIDDARRLRTPEAFLELAGDPAVSPGPRMRALTDSLRTIAAVRPTDTASPEATLRAQRIARLGVSIIAISQYRRTALLAEAGMGAATVAVPAESAVAPPVRAADTVEPPLRDTLPLVAALAAARDTLARAAQVHDSLTTAIASLDATTPAPDRSILARLVPAFATVVVLLLGLALRFASALRAETQDPTLADAAEAERVTGVRTLTTVRDALLDGPARFKPSGVDPFRMLYLSLTATGTRARTAIVAGPDLEIAAATGARLAIAAAADHRNTLIVDLDAASIALSRTFRERAEPGLRDVLAHAFTWREVARPVGSSDGLPITLLPAGTERDDVASGAGLAELLAEFERFRGAFELTIAVTPLAGVEFALSLVAASPILLTAVAGQTSIATLTAAVESQRAAGRKVSGLVIWDAPRPMLPTRAELAAQLSKRKGRTPGGSFEAVKRAIDPNNRDSKRS